MTQRNSDFDLRRQKVLDAARAVFAEEGGLDAGLRKIASAAGYTTGAIYKMFSGKEDIYAALLEESLTEVAQRVAIVAASESDPEAALRQSSLEFVKYYQEHPFEYRLGLYLFERDDRRSLGAERDERLNALLERSMEVLEACYGRVAGDRLSGAEQRDLAHATFAALTGVLALDFSKRDRSLKTHWHRVFDRLIDALILDAKR